MWLAHHFHAQIPASVDGTDLSGVFDDPTRTDLKEAAFVEAAVCKLKGDGTLWGNDYCPEEGWEGFMGDAEQPVSREEIVERCPRVGRPTAREQRRGLGLADDPPPRRRHRRRMRSSPA